jgi:hypothetical protein
MILIFTLSTLGLNIQVLFVFMRDVLIKEACPLQHNVVLNFLG